MLARSVARLQFLERWYVNDMKHALTILALCLCLPAISAEKAKPLPKDIPSLKALAETGDANAQNELGVRHYSGQGVKKNFNEAMKWFTKAAAQENFKAQYNLGILCEKGEGVIENDKEAVKWFTKAAAQGFAKAQADLGSMYFIGKGVKQNNFVAYAWWNIATVNGDEKAKKAKALVTKKMTRAEISKGQDLSRKLLKKYPKATKE
jgi:TPR repeat protein|tara:strand:- start:497 stop:1117 length:621 start_codon:yes stop_codon:yes gene_type:complete